MGKKRVSSAKKVSDSTEESIAKPVSDDVLPINTSEDVIIIGGEKTEELPTVKQLLDEAPLWPCQAPSAAQLETFKEDYKLWLMKLKQTA